MVMLLYLQVLEPVYCRTNHAIFAIVDQYGQRAVAEIWEKIGVRLKMVEAPPLENPIFPPWIENKSGKTRQKPGIVMKWNYENTLASDGTTHVGICVLF
ncbi:Uncharacterised protein [Mobiluncus mulieris]|nr:Uncharacterised protein [Mobiluncus mulieris]